MNLVPVSHGHFVLRFLSGLSLIVIGVNRGQQIVLCMLLVDAIDPV